MNIFDALTSPDGNDILSLAPLGKERYSPDSYRGLELASKNYKIVL
jgi:hypothetical protein